MSIEHIDVLIVGAGLSGIGAACHVRKQCPGKSLAVLESRDAIGGTWDLFRYPGIRSDSDMYTLGYSFKPWTHAKAIADGPSIREYVREAAREHGIDRLVRYGHKVKRASWSTPQALWTLEVERLDNGRPTGQTVELTCSFLYMCSGYYNYDAGFRPHFEGEESFQGRIVHPQKWTSDIDYAGKRVVVIGSGATAVTLVPSMAAEAAHVTMLQRSPTYIMSLPAEDKIANGLRKVLPAGVAYGITRWKNVFLAMLMYKLSKSRPHTVKRLIFGGIRRMLGPDADLSHFKPRYEPWDERLCLVPNGDLFKSLRRGQASIVTDHIERFTPGGILLKSGKELQADLVVTATGLDLQVFGGMQVQVDGKPVDFGKTMGYRGMMFSDVPNLANTMGYTNASWTLKADLTAEYVCRLLKHMDRHGWRQCTPRQKDPSVTAIPWIDLNSGYIRRAADKLPQQGSKAPWRLHQNYLLDLVNLRYSRVDDGVMEFSSPRVKGAGRAEAGRDAAISA
ncbi:MAG: NAD(P)/FAD-dependent oxidoreductase [Aquabacterium sp.]|jgi:monooxygenase|nr:MAG: NAD(P)/FAD-dependent oxidoreductase [Aquabacterium sp.]